MLLKTMKSRHHFYFASLSLDLIFYLSFILHDGPILCEDSPSYIGMEYSREPIYPLLLALFRKIFGTENSIYGSPRYLVPVVILQAVVMAVCVWYTARVIAGILPGRGRVLPESWRIAIRRTGKEKSGEADLVYTSEVFWYIGATLIFWGVDLLNRFFAARNSMYVECIMTESLCIPLFYLFLARTYLYLKEHRKKDLLFLFVLMFVMMSIRKQEMITCAIVCGFSFLYDLIGHRRWKAFLSLAVTSIAALFCMTLLDYSYNYAMHGVWMHHTHNYKGGACTLLYTATRDDADLFADEEDRKLFLDIYDQMEEQGLTYDSIPSVSDWIARTDHYADSYDIIGFNVMIPTIKEYVDASQPGLGEAQREIAVDEKQKVIQDTLLGQDKTNLLQLWRGSFAEGFVNTVLRKSRRLIGAALALYLIYFAELILLVRRRHLRRKKGASDPEDGQVLLFGFLVLFAIVVNVLVVGSMIFAQTRYMVYNMPFFYIAFFLMANRLLFGRGRKGREDGVLREKSGSTTVQR